MLIAGHGSQIDLLHILFGNVLAVDVEGLLLMTTIATASVMTLALMYRGLLLETFDSVFLAASAGKRGGRGALYQQVFLMLVVLNLVAAFQTLGTLMAVGLMMLPAIAARLWHESLAGQLAASSVIAMLASTAGLLLSYHLNLPSGPTVIVSAGVLYVFSLVVAPRGWLPGRRRPHLQA
jgi:zinc/manganese transport system permease protein